MLTLAEKIAQREVEKAKAYARGLRAGKRLLSKGPLNVIVKLPKRQHIDVYRAYCEGVRAALTGDSAVC